MKKQIPKNIFHFSNLIKALKKEKQKKNFFDSIWIKNQFQKTKIKIFNFGYEIEK